MTKSTEDGLYSDAQRVCRNREPGLHHPKDNAHIKHEFNIFLVLFIDHSVGYHLYNLYSISQIPNKIDKLGVFLKFYGLIIKIFFNDFIFNK